MPENSPLDGVKPGAPSDNTTLTAVVDDYLAAGYDATFLVSDDGAVTCSACGGAYTAGDLALHSLRRLEGASDPADMVAVAAVSAPGCDAKGLMVLRYGPEASPAEADVYMTLVANDQRGENGVDGAVAPGE